MRMREVDAALAAKYPERGRPAVFVSGRWTVRFYNDESRPWAALARRWYRRSINIDYPGDPDGDDE